MDTTWAETRPSTFQSTRGHSILRRGTYGYSPRAGVVDSFVPEYVPRKLGYETSSEEYSIGGAVTHATLNSDAFLYDNFDTASKSRGRDQQLLADATAAIVSSEAQPTPRTSVASKRVARKVFRPSPPVRTEVARYSGALGPIYYSARPRIVIVLPPPDTRREYRSASVPLGRSSEYIRERASSVPLGYAPEPRRERASSVPLGRHSLYTSGRASRPRDGSYERRRLPVYLSRRAVVDTTPAREFYWPYYAQAPLLRYRLGYLLPPAYVSRRKPRRAKAAIVASTVEVEPRRKRPRSKFAADKLRATRAPASEEAVQPTVTTGLHASRPPLYQSERKAIRDVDGFTKPRNLLSWQYRMESRVDPVDIMYKPGSFNRMRDQVRGAHDKLDRHRQLLDRYLVEGHPSSDISARVLRKTEELEQRNPSSK